MKSLKYLALCLVAALVTTSCSNDENEPQVSLKEGKPVKFEMSIARTNTRTVTTGSGNNRIVDWRVGDAVGIFVYNETTPLGSGNYKYVYDGTDWVAASTSDAINLQDGENYSFYAYYPYSPTGIASATNATLNVQTDQTTKDEATQNTGYDLSDILTAQTPNVSNGGTVALQFKHAFSMVEVLVAGDLVPSAPSSVILKGVATSAGINLTTGVVGATSANTDVTMCLIESEPTKTTYLYRAIVPAQTILANNKLLEVHGVGENGNKNYEFAHTEPVPYEQGKYRRIEVQIGKVEAGIKIPGGAIDEWTPSGGIDVPGKEMKVNLITIPISSLTAVNNDATSNNIDITKLNIIKETLYNTNNSFWYAVNDYSGETLKEVSLSSQEQAISYQMDAATPAYSWFKTGIGYHCNLNQITGFKPGYYKLTFNLKSDNATTAAPVVLRTIIRSTTEKTSTEYPGLNNNKDLFFSDSSTSGKTYSDITLKTNDWAAEPYAIYVDFKRVGTYTGTTTISNVLEDDTKIYQEFEIKFRFNKDKGGNVLIKDVQFEYIDESELPL